MCKSFRHVTVADVLTSVITKEATIAPNYPMISVCPETYVDEIITVVAEFPRAICKMFITRKHLW